MSRDTVFAYTGWVAATVFVTAAVTGLVWLGWTACGIAVITLVGIHTQGEPVDDTDTD